MHRYKITEHHGTQQQLASAIVLCSMGEMVGCYIYHALFIILLCLETKSNRWPSKTQSCLIIEDDSTDMCNAADALHLDNGHSSDEDYLKNEPLVNPHRVASFSFPPSFSYAVQSGTPYSSQLFIALNIFLSMFVQRCTRGCAYTVKRQEERLLKQAEEVKIGVLPLRFVQS
jgi:hypothetical protein